MSDLMAVPSCPISVTPMVLTDLAIGISMSSLTMGEGGWSTKWRGFILI